MTSSSHQFRSEHCLPTSLRKGTTRRGGRPPSALRGRRVLASLRALPIVLVLVLVFIPLAFRVKPTSQHPNLILFFHKPLKLGELFKQLTFLKRIKRRDLAQLGVQEGLENCIGVLKQWHMANQGRLLCCRLYIVRLEKSLVFLLFQVVNVFLECVISGWRGLRTVKASSRTAPSSTRTQCIRPTIPPEH